MRKNADFHVTKVLIDKTRKHQAKGVLKEQLITVAVKVNGVVTERLKLRRILFRTKDGQAIRLRHQQFCLTGRPDRYRLQEPLDDRATVQTD